MNFHFVIGGYGFGFQVAMFDILAAERIILQWGIIKNYQVWRSECHTRGDHGYHYRCIKNGKLVESISFRSPIVSHG